MLNALGLPGGSRSKWSVQLDVIGALILREMHTRFGRDNIGYLWMIAEPMMLALAVTLLHASSGGGHIGYGMEPVPFALTGYTPFVMFRAVVLRAESTIEANRTLLYHRMVTLTDMLVARALLEFASVLVALLVLLGASAALGFGTLPQRPLLIVFGMALLLWFAFGISLLVCAGSESSTIVGRLVHPATYVSLPLSGAFFLLVWVPEPYRTYLSWTPMVHIWEIIREGQFGQYDSAYASPLYVLAWCASLTFLGLLALRVTRATMHIE